MAAVLTSAVAVCLCTAILFVLTHPLIRDLQDSEAQNRAILATAVDGIITLDERGRIRSFNAAAERIFGRSSEEALGQSVEILMPPEVGPTHRESVRRYVEGGPARIIGIGREVIGVKQSGEIFPLELSVSEVQHRGERWFTGIVRDITRRKNNEQQIREAHDRLALAHQQLRDEHRKLVHAEKLSSIGLLASGVAHEINNPLSGVMACIKALQSGRVAQDRRAEYFDTAREGLERIQGIVRGLLDYAKQRPPRPTSVDVHEVVVSCIRLVAPAARKKQIQVVNRIATQSHSVQADRSQLMQAVVNILLNAIHAVSEGGRITFTAIDEEDRIGIRVTDNGPGIPQHVLERVCDPFFTTKPEGEGTGLGLAVSQGIVEAHQGVLQIDSVMAQGTTVTMWLPTRAV